MLHLRFSLLAFLILGVVVSGLTDTSTEDCDKEVKHGSEKTRVWPIERKLKLKKNLLDKVEKIIPFDPFKHLHIAIPGTRWCGDGNNEKTDEVGHFSETDACCRSHNLCANKISSDETLINLKNTGLFTRSAYTCDIEFYNCLKKANNALATAIGHTYFNIIGTQCFKCVCPTEECVLDNGTECKDKCKKYAWVKNLRF